MKIITTPCSDCPFRHDVQMHLGEQRRLEIARSLKRGESFLCHKTVHYGDDDWDEDSSSYSARGDEKHCAGAMILLRKTGKDNQYMQVGERLRVIDLDTLNLEAPVFDSLRDFVEKGL